MCTSLIKIQDLIEMIKDNKFEKCTFKIRSSEASREVQFSSVILVLEEMVKLNPSSEFPFMTEDDGEPLHLIINFD